MKNQYFGDKRDLFKFDLLLDLMASGGFRQLTYIPMLTRPEPERKEGLLLPRTAGKYRHELYAFLRAKCASAERDVRLWREFFDSRKADRYRVFRDQRADYDYVSRTGYFCAIEDHDLRSACVFLDPDIGIERGSLRYMKRNGLEKYLFLDDLEALVGRSEDSVFIVYQHLQKDAGKRLGDIQAQVAALSNRLGIRAVPFVRLHDVAFYALARDEAILREAAIVFSAHADKHDRLAQHVTDTLFVVKALVHEAHRIGDLAVFGSVARGEQGPNSDIDVMASFMGPATLRGFFELNRRLELFLGRNIDLVTSNALRPEMRPAIEREALRAA